MSKTPVSTLQEYMAKQALGLPEYVLIAQRSGTHLPSFTYSVTCGNKSAEGTATCKKEAKHNAAKELLKLLPNCNNVQQSMMGLTVSPPKNVSVDSYYSPGSANGNHDNIFVNSVGKLNEYCLASKLKSPEYTVSDISGPDHMRMFTMTCSVGSVSAKGTANTKKQAKHDAAQSMYQLLLKTTPKTNIEIHKTAALKTCTDAAGDAAKNVKILDFKIQDMSVPFAKSCERAKELFPKLRCRDTVRIVKDVRIEDYHKSLKNSVTAVNRETAKSFMRGKPLIVNKEEVLNKVLGILKYKLATTIAERQNGAIVVFCMVDSSPVIMDIGIGRNIAEAKANALDNLWNSIDTLLK